MVNTKNLISTNVGSQIPNFIVDEYPLFVDFIQTYYQGLETLGQPLDLINNFLNYIDVDNLETEIKTSCILTSDLDAVSATIFVDDTSGFPNTDGLLQIDSEIILYKSKTSNSFLKCKRGVSGVTNIQNEFQYSYSTSNSHNSNSQVINLSYLFLLYLSSKIQSEYLPYFTQSFAEGLNLSTFIKNIKQFYNYKGTTKSFDFVIRSLFNVKNETIYPRDRLFKSSDSIFYSPLLIRCFPVSGNVNELVGQQLYQSKINLDPANPEPFELISYAVTSVKKTFTSGQEVYELSVDKTNSPINLIVPPKTKLISPLNINDTIITVDSTIGFPETNGYLKINNEYIYYKEKTLNQFLGCIRGYYNTTQYSYVVSTEVLTTFLLYGNSNLNSNNKIYINVLGVVSSLNIADYGLNYNIGDNIEVSDLGLNSDSINVNSWIFNAPRIIDATNVNNGSIYTITTNYPHYLNVGDNILVYPTNSTIPVSATILSKLNDVQITTTQIPTNISKIQINYKFASGSLNPTDVINVYSNENSIYVASSGIPSHQIGTGFTIGNQRHLKKIPKQILTSAENLSIGTKDIGIFANGVTAQSFISNQNLYYGELKKIQVINQGKDYGVGISGGPIIQITPTTINGISTGITTTASSLVNGRVVAAHVISGGTGYTHSSVAQIVGSNGDGASIDLVIKNGVITEAVVTNPGSGYNFLPSVNITGSTGTGASIKLDVSGPITEVFNINDGLTYNLSLGLRNNPNFNLIVGRDKVEIYTQTYSDFINVNYDEVLNSRYLNIVTRGTGTTNCPKEYLISTGTTNIYSDLPFISVFSGSGAIAYPIINNGQIVNVVVGDYGYGYTCTPKVFINDSTGNGSGAEITANVVDQKIVSYTVLQKGAGYSKENTTISIVSSGENAEFIPIIKIWNKDLVNLNKSNLDSSNGYIFNSENIRYGKKYGYFGSPKRLRYQLSDNINIDLTEKTIGISHSKIIGWAYDGNPIYGPYGFANTNGTGSIVRMTSKYTLNSNRTNGPNINDYPLGSFIEDYTANNTQASLDEHNGRFCVTPEFPNGTYAYFTTIDSNGNLAFPYIVGKTYYSIPEKYNFEISNQNNLPKDVIRYTLPYKNTGYDYFPSILNKPIITVKDIEYNSTSSITGTKILYGGNNYSIGDKLLFNNNDNEGYGASGIVSSVGAGGSVTDITILTSGSFYTELPSITISSVSGQNADIVSTSNSIGKAKTIEISDIGYGLPIDYTLKPNLIFPTVLELKKTYSISNFIVTNPGKDYLYSPVVLLTGGDGIGATAEAETNNGLITKLNIINPGYGYSYPPTVNIGKSYPCNVNTFTSALEFNFNVTNIFSTGDVITFYGTTLFKINGSLIPIDSNTNFYVIVLPDNPYILKVATSLSEANSNQFLTFDTSGSNIKIISYKNLATAKAVLQINDFYNGEKIIQTDGISITASATVLKLNGWKKNQKILKVQNVIGYFNKTNPIEGLLSKSKMYVDSVYYGFGDLQVSSFGQNVGQFLNDTGTLSNASQVTIDSNYYQNYSYVLKNSIDYKKWISPLKSITHPSGFGVFGEKTIYNSISTGLSVISNVKIGLTHNIYNKLNLNEYKNYAICDPDYNTNIVNILNRKLISYEKIKTSLVQRFDNIGNGTTSYVGSGFTYSIPNQYVSIVQKDDIDVYVNNTLTSPSAWSVVYTTNGAGTTIISANVVFKSVSYNSNNIINLVFKGLKFDGNTTLFDLSISNNYSLPNFIDSQAAFYINGVLQDTTTYSLNGIGSQISVVFNGSNLFFDNNEIRIFTLPTVGIGQSVFAGTGASIYSVGNQISNSTSMVMIDGVPQNINSYSISSNNITFTENVTNNSQIYIRDFTSNLSFKQQIVAVSSGQTFSTSSQIQNKEKCLVFIDGIIINPNNYTIATNSIIFSTNVDSGSNINIYDFSSTLNINYERFISNDILNSINIKNGIRTLSTNNGIKTYYLNNITGYPNENYVIILNDVLQIPGYSFAYNITSNINRQLLFTEPPKPRSTFIGFLYNRTNPYTNAILNDFSKSYLQYSNYTGNDVVINDIIQEESTGLISTVKGFNKSTNTIVFSNIGIGNTFGVGTTLVGGLGTATTTPIYTTIIGSGITAGSLTVSVGSTANFLRNDYAIINNSEVVKINNISSNSFGIIRGRLNTTTEFYPVNSIISKIIPCKFTTTNVYTGFNGNKLNYSMSTGASTLDYTNLDKYALNYGAGVTQFSLPSSQIDIYGKDEQQSLLSIIDGVVQLCQSGSGSSAFSGSFYLNNNNFVFNDPLDAPIDGSIFYARYFGKLRRLKDISYLFNGNKYSFQMNIGTSNEDIPYSLESPNGNPSNNLLIFIDGVLQEPNKSFQIIGSSINFSSAPQPNSKFVGYVYIGSNSDVESVNIINDIESNDTIVIDDEINSRNILTINSSSSLATNSYTSNIKGIGAVATPVITNGKITNIIVNSGGTGYNKPPLIWISGSIGYGAQAYAKINNGSVTEIIVTNQGINYDQNYPPLIIFGKNLSLSKIEKNRNQYSVDLKNNIKTNSTISSNSTTIPLSNISNLPSSGIALLVDSSRDYPVIEKISYGSLNYSNNSLDFCIRKININFNKIFLTIPISLSLPISIGSVFKPGDIISLGTGSSTKAATIISVGSGVSVQYGTGSSLLFVNNFTTNTFSYGDVIQDNNGNSYRIINPNFIDTYYTYSPNIDVIVF